MPRRLALLAASCVSTTACLLAPAAPRGTTGDGGVEPDGGTNDAGGAGLRQVAYIKIGSPTPGDQAGLAIALSGDGDTLAVGVPLEDGGGGLGDPPDDSLMDAGAVYLFTRTGGVWAQAAYIKPLTPEAGARFGAAVALSQDGATLAVGAPDPTTALSRAGLAYVFVQGSSGWTEQARLESPAPDAEDEFGASVALSADGARLAVGVPGEDSSSPTNSADDTFGGAGAVYVFTRAGGSWQAPVYLKSPTIRAAARVGQAVAISSDGTVIAAGAPGDRVDNRGATYAFTTASSTSTAWTAHAAPALVQPSLGLNGALGAAVALSGTGATLVAGAPGDRSTTPGITAADDVDADAGATQVGATYVFEGPAAALTATARVKASNPFSVDEFGTSVAVTVDGGTLLVGAPGEDSGATGVDGDQLDETTARAGAAYLYALTEPRQQVAYLKASNTGALNAFGAAVALSADGATLAVGAPEEDGAGRGVDGDPAQSTATPDTGAVYVFAR